MKSLVFLIIVFSFFFNLLSNKQIKKTRFNEGTRPELVVSGSEGGELFNKYCSDCHAIKEEVYGPALKDIEKRRDKEWIISFVLNQEEFMKTDSIAAQMYKNSDELHTSFSSDLTTEQIIEILKFIEEESKK